VFVLIAIVFVVIADVFVVIFALFVIISAVFAVMLAVFELILAVFELKVFVSTNSAALAVAASAPIPFVTSLELAFKLILLDKLEVSTVVPLLAMDV